LTWLEERLKFLGLWTLEEHRNRQDIIKVFKMYRGYSSVAVNELFVIATNNKGTRGHWCKLKKVSCTRDVVHYLFSNKVVNSWKELDQSAVDATSISVFKKSFIEGQEQPDGLLCGLHNWALGLAGQWLASEAVHGNLHGKLGCNRQTDKWFGCVHKCSTRSVDILPTELCNATYSVIWCKEQ